MHLDACEIANLFAEQVSSNFALMHQKMYFFFNPTPMVSSCPTDPCSKGLFISQILRRKTSEFQWCTGRTNQYSF